MKFWSAAILLLVQARPIWGLVLCLGLGAGDQGNMETGCAMADHANARPAAVESGQLSVSDATPMHPAGHRCMLADICTLVSPTVALKPCLLLVPNAPDAPAVWPSQNVHGQVYRAPPTPPPNS
jgi:hypothetical protein